MLQYGAANTHAGQYRHRSLQREDSTTPTALKWLPVLFIPFAVLVPDALAARDPKIERPVGADVSGVSSRMEPCSMQFFCPSLQSDSTVRQSDSQTVRHSDTQTLRQSDSQTVRHSDTQTLRQCSLPRGGRRTTATVGRRQAATTTSSARKSYHAIFSFTVTPHHI